MVKQHVQRLWGRKCTVHLNKQMKAEMVLERSAGVRPMQAFVRQSQICALNSKGSREPLECLCNSLCF